MHADKIPKLLYELIKNSRRSDRDLAKVLGFSQPTVTRTRSKLEEEKYILQYTALPDFSKLGFELVAFTFAQRQPTDPSKDQALYDWLEKEPRVVFAAQGNGLAGKDWLIVTVHKDYTDCSDFIANFKQQKGTTSTNSFMITLAGIKKPLSLAGLEKV